VSNSVGFRGFASVNEGNIQDQGGVPVGSCVLCRTVLGASEYSQKVPSAGDASTNTHTTHPTCLSG